MTPEERAVIVDRLRLAHKATQRIQPPSVPFNDWPTHYEHDIEFLLDEVDRLNDALAESERHSNKQQEQIFRLLIKEEDRLRAQMMRRTQ
jgi:hypothetical protein